MKAWVMLEMVRFRPEAEGDPTLMRADNMAAVSWVSRYGGARDEKACLFIMRIFGRLELEGGWILAAKYIPGVHNTLEDGISRSTRTFLA